MKEIVSNLLQRIESGDILVGIVGLGYVGLPLAIACARVGYSVVGFDIDEEKPRYLMAGQSYIGSVTTADLRFALDRGLFQATSDISGLSKCDFVVICVPTPLTPQREPDLRYIVSTAEALAQCLRRGQTIVLESTTWPGTTRSILVPILERSGLVCEKDFYVGFSPEREDPGNTEYSTRTIAKVVSGIGVDATALIERFYGRLVSRAVVVSSTDAAEAVKITENVFRAVNIALVNELKIIFDAMNIDIWEIIEAAKTKPFGYMPFYPGPGLGGHCIPIDPFYLTWRAREFDTTTRFIELAGEINRAMPRYVLSRLDVALDRYLGKSLSKSRILICGLAYKKNVSDIRESPSLRLMELLKDRGCTFSYHDPYVVEIPRTREHAMFAGMQSISLSGPLNFDAAVIVTDHDNMDYIALSEQIALIVDTRNAIRSRDITTDAIVVRA